MCRRVSAPSVLLSNALAPYNGHTQSTQLTEQHVPCSEVSFCTQRQTGVGTHGINGTLRIAEEIAIVGTALTVRRILLPSNERFWGFTAEGEGVKLRAF